MPGSVRRSTAYRAASRCRPRQLPRAQATHSEEPIWRIAAETNPASLMHQNEPTVCIEPGQPGHGARHRFEEHRQAATAGGERCGELDGLPGTRCRTVSRPGGPSIRWPQFPAPSIIILCLADHCLPHSLKRRPADWTRLACPSQTITSGWRRIPARGEYADPCSTRLRCGPGRRTPTGLRHRYFSAPRYVPTIPFD